MVTADSALVTLLDTTLDVAERLSAVREVKAREEPAVIEALTRVAQQKRVPSELADEVGRTLGYLCFRRAQDVHELDMAMFSDDAGEAYDEEVGRLQRLHPEVTMRRPD